MSAQQPIQDSIALVKSYHSKAEEATFVHDFDAAFLYLAKANKLAAQLDDVDLKAKVHLSMANLNYFLLNYVTAEQEAYKAIVLLKTIGDEQELAQAYVLYGFILVRNGKFEQAERYFKEADEVFITSNNELDRSKILLGLGFLEQQRGNQETALNYFDASIPLFNSFELKYQEAFAYLNKAQSLLLLQPQNTERWAQSLASLEKAKEILDQEDFSRLEIQYYELKTQLAILNNDTNAANINLSRFVKTKDSVSQVYLTAISNGYNSADIGDYNDIIESQREELDKQNKSMIFTRMTTALSIALIVILSLLTLSLYKNNNLRAKANELLKDKNNELLLAKEKAEKASLAKAQFLSTITHELRTPLYAVTGLTHLLLEEDPKPNQKEHLNSLKFSGDYLLSLINNILDLNKLEANKVEIEKTTFNLERRINDVLVALKKSADDRKNQLTLEFDQNIPKKLVGDPLKLSQILINLIGNSLKFTQIGEVAVRIQVIDQSNKKIMLHFEIEDNGVGISKKKQKSIFETFAQGSLQINRKFGGTGLGLSIVKNLLEIMNSKIQLESQLGKGSKFWFNIAFDISEEVKEPVNPKNIIYDVDYVALENKKVLVVEDNKINQMITKKILEKNKMQCMVADNGMDAVKLVEEHAYDVILMDIHMPGISGIEATQKIREFNKQVPIIALTAVTIDENLDDFYRAGFNEIIPKPFKTEEFFEKIFRTIEGQKFPITSPTA
ncbi:MAG: response regulator [Flavobacteriaceae bacterium]|nr:response regulator [Flavobacteriaceae bacterium]